MGTTIKWSFIFCSLVLSLKAQDTRLWLGASSSYAFNKKWELGLEIQQRWTSGGAKPDAFLVEPSLTYEPIRNLRFGAAWRFAQSLDDATNAWHLRHRPQIDIELRHRWGRWRPFVRTRFQARYTTLGGVNKPWMLHFRTKAGIKYLWPRSPLSHTLFVETWFPLNRDGRDQPDRYRAGLNTSLDLGKSHELSLQLAFEERFRSGPNPQAIILGLFYSFSAKTP
jgi:hypothetical protein